MVKIRLRRMGAKKQPSYRVVVTDSRSPRDGRFLEIIGRYDPRTDPPTVVIREDRALYWMSVGAQPTDAVATFFRKLDLEAKIKKVHGGEGIDALSGGQVRVSGPAEAPAKQAIAKRTRSVPEKGKGRGKAAPDAESAEADETVAVEARPKGKAKAAAEATAPEAAAVAETAPAVDVEEAPAGALAEAALVAEATPVAEAPAVVAKPAPVEKAEPKATAAKPKAAAEGKAEGKPASTAEGDLASLGLPSRTAAALEAAGVHDVKALRALSKKGDDALLAVPGIGAKAVDDIRAKLGG